MFPPIVKTPTKVFLATMPTATLIRCATWRCGSTSYPPSVVVAVAVPSDCESSRSNHEVNNSIIPKVQGPKKKPVVKKSQPDVKVSIRTRKKCSQKGCINGAVEGGVCVTHGAKRKRCSFEGCPNRVQQGGVCVTHGAKVRARKQCRIKGCTNQFQKGGVCITHGAIKERKRCSHGGCTKQAIKGGVCVTHGAKVKLCSVEGCTKQFKKGGVCYRHRSKSIITINNPSQEAITELRTNNQDEEELNSWIWRSSRVQWRVTSNNATGP